MYVISVDNELRWLPKQITLEQALAEYLTIILANLTKTIELYETTDATQQGHNRHLAVYSSEGIRV